MTVRVLQRSAPLAALLLVLAGCSSGGSSGSTNAIASAVQDLSLDPFGATTVLTFTTDAGLADATTADFEADDGQTPTDVDVAGDTVTITWDERVSPSTQVRALLSGVSSAYSSVTASDTSAPTFTITDGTQGSGPASDTISIAFDGPYVVESGAENPDNWTLVVDETTLDLSDSLFTFDPDTQTLEIELGVGASLFADFELSASGVQSVADVAIASTAVAGVASGDATAPSLVSAEQNLTEDEYGRVVDFTFDEAMNPYFNTQLSHYGVTDGIATSVDQPSPTVLRVSFSQPIVPGIDEVTLLGLVDLHGNTLADGPTAVAQPSPVVNEFDGDPELLTVANAGSDTLTIVTTQAFDAEAAVDPDSWILDVDGSLVDLSTQTLEYDFEAKTLTITLDFDATNGDSFELVGFGVLEIDGESFLDSFIGTIGGDAVAPTLTTATQNRSVDSTGKSIDVAFSEDVDEASAETTGNWSVSGGLTVQSATRLPSFDVVRLVLSDVAMPGDVTLDVSALTDLAGNTLTPASGVAISSTDTTAPAPSLVFVEGIEGALNDTVEATFDDDMYVADIEDPANWSVEVPAGNAISTAGATVVYDTDSRMATLTFADGFAFQRGDTYEITFANARDVGGNTVTSTAFTGSVDVESRLPSVEAAYASASQADVVVVRFDEPCAQLDDLYDVSTNPFGSRYVLRDSLGVQRGLPISAAVLDGGLGVELTYGIVIAGSDTLDVYGLVDAAGNPLFPEYDVVIEAEATQDPDLDALSCSFTAFAGESNDEVVVTFDRQMSTWELTDAGNFVLETEFDGAIDLTPAVIEFDGTTGVTIDLRATTNNNLQFGDNYTITVTNVRSAQGTLLTGLAATGPIVADGDSTPPSVGVSSVRLDPSDANSLLIETSEAVDETTAETAAFYDLDSGNLATSATKIGPRMVRATFAVTPSAGQTLELTLTDLAGNVSGSISRTVQTADASGPLVASVSGQITPGWGGDMVTISFNESVTPATALTIGNYAVQAGSTALSLVGSRFRYRSETNAVEIQLAAGQELDAGANVTVTVGGVVDHAGNSMAATISVGGSVGGDSTAPTLEGAFVNWREDSSGATVDVLFSEDVSTTFAGSFANWTVSGGNTVTAATVLERDHVRLVLSAPLGSSDTLGITGVPDVARNAAGALSIDPVE